MGFIKNGELPPRPWPPGFMDQGPPETWPELGSGAFKPFKLPDHIQEEFNKARSREEERRVTFAMLSNADLVTSAKFWMHHCSAPQRYAKDEPIYDATFWHVIVPELLKRVEQKD